MNILLVEDNLMIIKGLAYSLEKQGYSVQYKTNLQELSKYLQMKPEVDLIILDITLPDGNALSFYKSTICKQNIPTIFLTAKDDEETIVDSLNSGAEDYITKPFSTKELLARINKILLRNKKETIIQVDNIKFDMDKMIVYKDNKEIKLTSLELKLLHLLFLNINKVVTRNTILDKIWEWTGNFVDDHTVTVYFKRIREKLETDIIKTMKGIGYRIDKK